MILPLRTSFSKYGYTFTQVLRERDVAIFSQTKPDRDTVRYEVVRILPIPATTWPTGEVTPAREVYPSSEKWGVQGWTELDLPSALSRLRSLL